MDGGSIAQIVIAVLGGGAIGSVITGITQYMLAKAKQPVDQYDGLVGQMRTVMNQERQHFEAIVAQERKHHDDKIKKIELEMAKLEAAEDACIAREMMYREQLGELRGQLNEQRKMLGTVLKQSEVAAVAEAIAQDQNNTTVGVVVSSPKT